MDEGSPPHKSNKIRDGMHPPAPPPPQEKKKKTSEAHCEGNASHSATQSSILHQPRERKVSPEMI